jgi:type IV pilus assembly protein PilY1
VIVAGLGAGGKGYYALNVTNPNDLDTEASAKNNVMWEFTPADDDDNADPAIIESDLGYSFSEPLIAMSNAVDGSGNNEWIAIFGNGYNSTSTDGDAVLYILRIERGQDGIWTAGSDFVKVNTGYGKAESADGTTPNGIGGIRVIDADHNGTADFVYAGDLQGNLWRFNITSNTASNWTTTPTKIFEARYKAGDAFPRDVVQPITNKPMIIKHPTKSGFIVIVGTGSWMTTNDATSTDIQSIYGIWDPMCGTPYAGSGTCTSLASMTSTTNQLVEQVFTNYTNTEHGFTVRTLTNNPVNYTQNGNASSYVKGWYIDLDVLGGGGSVEFPGERAIRNIQVRGGILFVNTVIPKDTAACSAGVGGFELAFNPVTGGSGSTQIFDLNGDNEFDVSDNVNDTDGDGNIVTGVRFDTDTPTDSAFIGSRRMTQAGDEIRSINTNTNTGAGIGRTSWREIQSQ